MKVAIIIFLSIVAIAAVLQLFSSCNVIKTSSLNATRNIANMYYNLPKGFLKITCKVKVFVYTDKKTGQLIKIDLISQSFDHEKEIVPDSSQSLRVNYRSNPFSLDDINIKINDKGLLTTVDVTTEDRLPVIVESLAKAPAEILGVGGAAKGEEDLNVEVEEFSRVFILNPDEFPKDIIWTVAKNDNSGNSVDMDVSFSIRLVSPPQIGNPATVAEDAEINGIVTRPMKQYKFCIIPKATMLSDYMIEFYEYLPNHELNITIPLNRAFFAKKLTIWFYLTDWLKRTK